MWYKFAVTFMSLQHAQTRNIDSDTLILKSAFISIQSRTHRKWRVGIWVISAYIWPQILLGTLVRNGSVPPKACGPTLAGSIRAILSHIRAILMRHRCVVMPLRRACINVAGYFRLRLSAVVCISSRRIVAGLCKHPVARWNIGRSVGTCCMYVCMCFMHVCEYRSVFSSAGTCDMYVCMYEPMILLCICIYVQFLWMYVHTSTLHGLCCSRALTCSHVRKCVCIYMYICIYIHTHTQT